MKTVTVTQLRSDIYNLLEEVLQSGVPLEVSKGGRKLHILPVEKVSKLDNLVYQPELIVGDPEDLVNITWDVNLDLP